MAEKTQRAKGPFSPLAEWLLAQGGALAVLLIGAAFIVGGLQLGSSAGRFPIMLGGVTVALALLEIIGGAFSKANDRQEETRAKLDRREIKAIAWIFLTIVAIYVVGILLGAFISTILFCRFIEGRGILKAIGISMLNVFVIWFAFSYLASFDLYRGAIF
jgi:hypothetical protein